MRSPKPREHEIQAAIVDALHLAGLTVYETTAYRQKGASGVDKGIPDLLVVHPEMQSTYMGIEVKRPGPVTWSSIEQRIAHAEGHFALAQCPREALRLVMNWLLVTRTGGLTVDKLERTLRGLEAA